MSPQLAVCTSRISLGSVVVVYPPHPPQCVGVLVCVVCGETHRQHRLVVTPVTSSLTETHPPVSSTAVIIWRKGRERVGIEIDIFIIVYFMPKTVREKTK